MKPTLIIDSMHICYRAKHTMCSPGKPGQHNCCIIGFLKEIQSFIKLFKTDDLVFCWDSKESERRKIFPKYQYKRHDDSKKTPEEIRFDIDCIRQFKLIKYHMIPAMGFVNNYLQTGHEADDIIARLVMYYSPEHFKFITITNDQDYYQLLDYTDIYDPRTRQIIKRKDFWYEYKLTPKQWIDYKAIAGCNSDKVPGIKGVGEKTALKYLRKEPIKPHFQKRIDEGEEAFKLCKKLVELPFPGTKLYKIKYNNLSYESFNEKLKELNIALPNKLKSFYITFLEGLL